MNGRMRTECRALLKMDRLQQRMTWILMERNPNTEDVDFDLLESRGGNFLGNMRDMLTYKGFYLWILEWLFGIPMPGWSEYKRWKKK